MNYFEIVRQMQEAMMASDKPVDFWLKDATINSLLEEAEMVRVVDDGIIEVSIDGTIIGCRPSTLLVDGEICHMLIEYVFGAYDRKRTNPGRKVCRVF